jgi:hypothetical protein
MAMASGSGDGGWLTTDADADADGYDVSDPDGEIDFDALCLHAAGSHTFDGLTPLERSVLCARFGLENTPVRSMKQLHNDLGLTRHQVRDILESALDKVRRHLAS